MADQDRRYIYPAKGATIRDPGMSMQPIPEGGQEVIWSLHWQQLLRFGDISVETDAQKDKRIKAEEEARRQAEKDRREAERLAREEKAAEGAKDAAKEPVTTGQEKKG